MIEKTYLGKKEIVVGSEKIVSIPICPNKEFLEKGGFETEEVDDSEAFVEAYKKICRWLKENGN